MGDRESLLDIAKGLGMIEARMDAKDAEIKRVREQRDALRRILQGITGELYRSIPNLELRIKREIDEIGGADDV